LKEYTIMADLNSLFDKAFAGQDASALADAPVDALAGVSEADAVALKKALNIKTVRELAENKFVLVAQAVTALANASKK
jgi:hypothetical protein